MTVEPDGAPVQLCAADDLCAAMGNLEGRGVLLMGLGLFGGGEGAARFLAERGARVTVTDLRPAQTLADPLARLDGLPLCCRLGEHRTEDFTDADLVVANPAVPRTSPYLRAAQEAGVPITSPMNLFLTLCPAPVAAVTGSNGKSTTTSLLACMLRSAGLNTWLGGNIGVSLLPKLPQIEPSDVAVLELSSFQLADAAALRWSPHLAVVTNLTPNHLDRHRDFGDYATAKRTIVDWQGPDDFVILNAHAPVLRGWLDAGLPGRVYQFDSRPQDGALVDGMNLLHDRMVWTDGSRREVICSREDVPLVGRHNAENAMAAAAAARCLGAGAEAIRDGLASFSGLEHRLELVATHGGVRYYNDSNSTTPASSVAAVESFPGALTLIAGGYDKKLDMTPLARAAARHLDVLVTLGQTGPALAQQVRRESLCAGRSVVIHEAADLAEAVRAAAGLSMPGSAVVLSPGCASFDMFENCEHRGRVFKDLVRRQSVRRRGEAAS